MTMREYVVLIGGVEHTVQLPADEAARIGARPVAAPAKQGRVPLNKQAPLARRKD